MTAIAHGISGEPDYSSLIPSATRPNRAMPLGKGSSQAPI